ncbi:rsbT co-antagonist protein RsbR [Bacillus sp. SORGH_AS 510]|uniref:STAS domain-containing protein n=1 Tax=Bacillus sp. SORGH_AS_0510 TaxID=3041771 RepID=UPI002789EBCD|nr:STAS domain-containing protein [Bacillus sp. SORGH_AS_0510]MDQ1143597.1 rsbT co-antagonist protein RsbR [Bacillus sp. SORGH_AS_0510]
MENATRMIQYIQTNRGEILQEWVEKMSAMDEQKLSTVITDQVYSNVADEYINILVNHLINQDQMAAKNKIRDFSQKLVQLGWTLNFIMDSLMEFSKIVFFRMVGQAEEKEQIEFGWAFDKWVTPINKDVLNHYAASWQRTVSLQKIALQELSAPLIPIFDNITVMPLVGTIDTERAKRIMENLLQGVVKHHAQVVLIDITGVPVVDTMVAHHIIQASEAVRLVGAKCLIVGIRPEIAQTIVNLGINLDQVVTKSSLQKGVAAALEMTNRKIVSVEE